jgi:inosine-uridine nucleoside N-ribohydrolase
MNPLHRNYAFTVPESKKVRVIIDTDAKNEADDQYAIVHALLTPKLIVKGLAAAHFGTRRTDCSMEESFAELERLRDLMDLTDEIPIVRGSPCAIGDAPIPLASGASELIAREALSDDPRPLFCVFLGPLTDMAAALMLHPEIANRLTVIWIGGGKWPAGGEEFNLSNDVRAANIVYGSNVPLWQVPRDVYLHVRVSLAELQREVMPCGPVGEYLYRQLVAVNDFYGENAVWPAGESWVLGDSCAIGLLLDSHEYRYEEAAAPRVADDMRYIHDSPGRTIRMYTDIDGRFILADLYAKLALYSDD